MFTRETNPAKPPKQPMKLSTRILLGVLAVAVVMLATGTVRRIVVSTPAPPAATEAPVQAASPPPAVDAPMPVAPAAAPAPAGKSCGKWTAKGPATWVLVGGTAVPSSRSTGPAFTDPVRWCYAHTQDGALYAAANYLGQMSQPGASPTLQVTLALNAMANTPAREAFVAVWKTEAQQIKTTLPVQPSTIAAPQFIGYHFTAYTPDVAVLDLANSWDGVLYSSSYTLRYQGGDWKLDPPANGKFPMRAIPQLDPSYYTLWSSA